jgi:predicted anti-sigma-YlaC factor YlaD
MPRGEERRGFVVNLDAETESNLQKVSRKELAAFGARLVGVREADEVSMGYLEFGAEHGLWPPLLAGLVFLLTAECLLARKP